MDVRTTKLRFRYKRKIYEGIVSEMQPTKEKIVRVSVVTTTDLKHPQVFVFYRRNSDELFWYDYKNKTLQAMAWKIAKVILEK